jgi:hypothetical protein
MFLHCREIQDRSYNTQSRAQAGLLRSGDSGFRIRFSSRTRLIQQHFRCAAGVLGEVSGRTGETLPIEDDVGLLVVEGNQSGDGKQLPGGTEGADPRVGGPRVDENLLVLLAPGVDGIPLETRPPGRRR